MSARRDAGLFEGDSARPDARRRVGQVDAPAGCALHRLARAAHADERPRRLAGDLRGDDDERAAAVADDAAVEPVQRVGDQRRGEHVLHRDDLAQHRVRVVLRVVRRRDLDPRQLLGGRAELVHVAASPPSRRCSHRAARTAARTAPPADRSGPRGDRPAGRRVRGRPASVTSATLHFPAAIACAAWPTATGRRRAAGLGRVDVAHMQPEVVGQRQRADAGRVAGSRTSRRRRRASRPASASAPRATCACSSASGVSGALRSGCS